MRNHHGWALAALTATLGVILGVAGPALSQKPPQKIQLPAALANKTRVAEDDVSKVLEALGPIIREKLANGETIEIAGLGTFRVVRIPEHKDMVQGRPATIAATNSVEFLPIGEVVQSANAPNAVPAATVPVFEYNPLPNQAPTMKTPYLRVPNNRSP